MSDDNGEGEFHPPPIGKDTQRLLDRQRHNREIEEAIRHRITLLIEETAGVYPNSLERLADLLEGAAGMLRARVAKQKRDSNGR